MGGGVLVSQGQAFLPKSMPPLGILTRMMTTYEDITFEVIFELTFEVTFEVTLQNEKKHKNQLEFLIVFWLFL
jgi:hypothetical protein